MAPSVTAYSPAVLLDAARSVEVGVEVALSLQKLNLDAQRIHASVPTENGWRRRRRVGRKTSVSHRRADESARRIGDGLDVGRDGVAY